MKKKLLALVLALLMINLIGAGVTVKADAGTVYSCTIHPCYKHPVTGEIEDSGGSSAYATGQGMVEGVLGTKGMLEVTDDSRYYLTFRMSLIDYTSDQQFQVQNRGESTWQDTAMGVTQTGTDENGTTADVCVEIPSDDCVVRGSMYVEPMGRSVIYYLYPSDFKKGAPSDMLSTIVTESSKGKQGAQKAGTDAPVQKAEEEKSDNHIIEETTLASDAGASENIDAQAQGNSAGGGTAVNRGAGLSLSTAVGSTADGGTDGSASADNTAGQRMEGGFTAAQWILILTTSFVLAGVILLGIAAWIVKYFLDNRWRWFDDDDDENDTK